MTKSWFVLFFLSLTFSYPSWAADFNKGVEAYQNGNYEVAFDEWAALAEDDDPMSQYGLGILYREGKGVSQDFDEAFNWFELSADGNTFVKAEAVINGNSVEVSAQEVPDPKFVRMGWYDTAIPTLQDKNGWPVCAFPAQPVK